ncbi:MAG: hypothetical protein ACI32C_04625 [Candidatus Enteromonas sp.]
MKNHIRLLTLSAGLLMVGLGASYQGGSSPVARELSTPNTMVAHRAKESVRKYIPMTDEGWVEDGLEKRLANRNDTYWNLRSFNALDVFYRGEGVEAQTGTLTSPAWNQSGDYITFTLGGKVADGFVGIFAADADVNTAEPLAKVTMEGWFADPQTAGSMVVRVVDATSFKGKDVRLAIVDRNVNGFGFFDFGALQVNQSIEEVAATIDLHKQMLATGDRIVESDVPENCNNAARDYTINLYNAKYASYLEHVGELDRYDLGFEMDPSTLELFGVDPFYGDKRDIDFYYDLMVTDRNTHWWGENIPFNKTGNRFLCTQNGLRLNGEIGDYEPIAGIQTRFVTPAFTLSGSGFLSVKMGGKTAALQILDASNNEILDEVKNPAFITKDNGVFNIFDAETNMTTMVRTIIDASKHLGKKIRIALADTGLDDAPWSSPNFDELVTYYENVPSIRVDALSQHHGENHFYGERLDYFVATSEETHPEMKEAYNFLFGERNAEHAIGTDGFYSIIRAHSRNGSWCDILGSDELSGLMNRYDALSPEAKAIVDASEDYDHQGAEGAWYTVEANTGWNVGSTMAFIASYSAASGSVSLFANRAGGASATSSAFLICVAAFGVVSVAGFLLFRKKKHSKI